MEDLVELLRLLDKRHVAGILNDDFPVTVARCASLPIYQFTNDYVPTTIAPSTRNTAPEMKLASSDARKR